MSTTLNDLHQQAQQHLNDKNYSHAESLYQELIAADPTEKMYCWYLGLTLLLQGQELEAQTAWMLAMVDGDSAQTQQWTEELVGVLDTAANDHIEQADAALAWVIRQHLREIDPTHLPNLLHLLRLSIKLGTFDPNDLEQMGITALITKEQAPVTHRALLLDTLKELLELAPLEAPVIDFAAACAVDNSDFHEFALVLLGTAIRVAHALARPLVAVQYAKICLSVYPNHLNILGHLSHFYQDANQHEAGIEVARTFCTLAQTLPEQMFGAFTMLRSLIRAASEWDKIFAIFEHQDELVEALVNTSTDPLDETTVLMLTTTTFHQPYLRDSLAQNRLNQNRLMGFCQQQVERYASDRIARYQAGFANRRKHDDATRPIRLGYVSHCLRQHSVGWLSRWLFQYHDHDRFQIHGYFWNAEEPIRDSLQQRLVQQVDKAHILKRDSQEIADRIFADEIDILIDLDSITADVGCETMMMKPAPVQVCWLGWDAPGMPAIDYYIADHYVLPDGAESHYVEKLWRLPQTYIAVDGFEVGVPTLRRDQLDIPTDAIVYWSGQSAYKRHPGTVRAQLEIIKAVPNSYFLIKGITDDTSIQRYFQQIAAEIGVDLSRLRFLPDVAEETVHRANLSIADVVLDTYPYNGATTTLETLWMGLPLVTRVGEHFSSRNSYGMMINAGITEGIAHSEAEYIAWGIKLGQDPELRQKIAWKLQQSRQTSPLWNGKAFTREMENAYLQMWQAYLQQSPISV